MNDVIDEESYYSWTVLSPDTIEKEMDRSTVKSKMTGIPIPLRSFFDIEHLDKPELIVIELNFEGISHQGHLRMLPNGRTRLSWRASLDSVIRSRFPVHHKLWRMGNEPAFRPKMIIRKDPGESKRFFVSFKAPEQTEPKMSLTVLETLEIGYAVSADQIARLSGQNQQKGIHYVKNDDGTERCVIILCTIGGAEYPNEWIANDGSHSRLKYYLEGRKKDKTSKLKYYNPAISSNQAVIRSKESDYPIYVFVRERDNHPYLYEGVFVFDRVLGHETDMYFHLSRVSESLVENIFEQMDLPDNENDSLEVREGKRRWKTHLAIERKSSIVKAAKAAAKAKYGKLLCEVCNFDFREHYGERGENYIEGHHTVPLHELGPDGGNTKIEDIALLCANCHRMIHKTRDWLSVDQLKSIYRP